MRRLCLPLAILAVCAATGLAVGAETVQSRKERNPSPQVSKSNVEALAAGNTEFAYALYQNLRRGKGNLFLSPYSISEALAMAYAGARGETEQQMRRALRFALPEPTVHPAFDALDLELASRNRAAAGRPGRSFQMTVANALWGQEGLRFLPAFLDTLAGNYGAGMNLVDFSRDPEGARSTINQWVAARTNDKIQNLLPPGLVDSLTRLVLTDAIYFDALWARPFPKDRTCPGEFMLLDGQKVGVEMMVQSAHFRYAEGSDYQAVELPYFGNEVAMVLLVPKQGRFGEFEGSLTAKRAAAILKDLAPRTVGLTMPKFSYESEFMFKKALSDLGMPIAFESGKADFSGMDGKRDLFIAGVVHKALVRVDEEGTEAAAATAAVIAGAGAPDERPVELTVDRPFIFTIRDGGTGTVLFMGRVVDPRTGPGATTKVE